MKLERETAWAKKQTRLFFLASRTENGEFTVEQIDNNEREIRACNRIGDNGAFQKLWKPCKRFPCALKAFLNQQIEESLSKEVNPTPTQNPERQTHRMEPITEGKIA